jgi:hypothetical protein
MTARTGDGTPMSEALKIINDPRFVDDVLWQDTWEAYGATLTVQVVRKNGSTYCVQGKLSYGSVVPLGGGNLCVTQTGPGEYTVSGDAEIKEPVLHKKVATAEIQAKVKIENGAVRVTSAQGKVCGSNTQTLKCKTWNIGLE